MKRSILITTSGILLLLVLLIGHRRRDFTNQSPDGTNLEATAVAQQPMAPAKSARIQFATNTIPFDWSMLASEDLKVYIRNLRAVGCPEQTIRDIIVALVNRRYGPQLAALKARPNAREYWTSRFRSMPRIEEEKQRQYASIDGERKALLEDLFGVDPEAANRKLAEGSAAPPDPLAFLPQEKQASVRALLDGFSKQENELQMQMASIGGGKARDAMQQLTQQKETELANILTPEEMEQYLLRNSKTAQQLQFSLQGFSPTEAEFRSLFDLQHAFDQKYSGMSQDDPAVVAARTELNAQIKGALGTERYADYLRSQDSAFQNLRVVAERYDLPENTAPAIYALKQSAEQQQQSILQATTDPSQQQTALDQLKADTQQKVIQLLGERAFKSYQQRGASRWIDGLGTTTPPPPTGSSVSVKL
jgi:hypothetical protein